MPEHDVSPAFPGRRRAALGVALVALAALAAVAVYAAAVAPDAPDAGRAPVASTSTPAASPAPTASPPASPPPAAAGDEAAAVEVVAEALAVPLSTATTAEELDGLLADTVTDSYAAEVTAQWQELTAQGWTLSGTPRVISADATAGEQPGLTDITACIDSSDVVVRDTTGAPVGDVAAMMPRALHLFTVVRGADGTWRVAAHSFPDDPAC